MYDIARSWGVEEECPPVGDIRGPAFHPLRPIATSLIVPRTPLPLYVLESWTARGYHLVSSRAPCHMSITSPLTWQQQGCLLYFRSNSPNVSESLTLFATPYRCNSSDHITFSLAPKQTMSLTYVVYSIGLIVCRLSPLSGPSQPLATNSHELHLPGSRLHAMAGYSASLP